MPLRVSLRGVPRLKAELCPAFVPAIWWVAEGLMEDPRFRVTAASYWYSIGCFSRDEMREFQDRFRSRAKGIDHWERDSDQPDNLLADPENEGRWWVVTVYEWESGVE